MASVNLKIDWATYAACKYACEKWHYSGCLPSSLGKRVAMAVYEDELFIGVVVFGHGANPHIGDPYGLTINQCVELTRIALKKGHKTPVSRIVKIVLKMFAQQQKGIRLIVSYADQSQGHHGGIYQAGNWIYVGSMKGIPSLFYKGKVWHPKALRASHPGVKRSTPGVQVVQSGDKHKYLMPLDDEIRKSILPLAMPYPKRVKQAMTSSPEEQRQGGTDPHAP